MKYAEFQVRIRPLADTQRTIVLPQLSADEFQAVASVVDSFGISISRTDIEWPIISADPVCRRRRYLLVHGGPG
jgi:hypothetical protein